MTDEPNEQPQEPTDAQIKAMLGRIDRFALMALSRHPQRDRAIELLRQGGWLFAHPLGALAERSSGRRRIERRRLSQGRSTHGATM
jgi:hypothetical protein